jgi:hypothetical protein
MILDRPLAQVQPGADAGIGQPLGQQAQDRFLSRGEMRRPGQLLPANVLEQIARRPGISNESTGSAREQRMLTGRPFSRAIDIRKMNRPRSKRLALRMIEFAPSPCRGRSSRDTWRTQSHADVRR